MSSKETDSDRGIRIFCDFDGTISVKDVGAEFFNGLVAGDHRKILDDWFNGRISSLECLTKECELVRVTREDADRLIDKQEVEPSFLEFHKEIRSVGIELIVLSDGFDYYIERVLRNYGIEDVTYYANKLIFYDTNRVRPEFPYYDSTCSFFANCKGLQLQKLNTDNKVSVYIGDGYSDKCAVPYADIIFAKGEFYEYCQKESNSRPNGVCNRFNDFFDILNVLKEKFPNYFIKGGNATFNNNF